MKDRNTQYPGRKKLTIISQSSSEIVADVERYEGTVTEAGTPLNKANILPDTTAESLGLDPEADPTPADALNKIATDIGDMNLDTTATDLTGAVNEIVSDPATNPEWPNLESSGWKWKKYADGTCQLWYKGNVSATSASSTGAYYATSDLALPFTLTALHGAWASSSYLGILTGADMYFSTTSSITVRYFRMTSFGTQSMPTTICVEGRWK